MTTAKPVEKSPEKSPGPFADVVTCPECGQQRLGNAKVEAGTGSDVSVDEIVGILTRAEESPEYGEPEPDTTTTLHEVFPDLQPWVDVACLRERIFRVLRPVALMSRVYPEDEADLAALMRWEGGQPITTITNRELGEVLGLLLDLGDTKFAAQIAGDPRYDPEAGSAHVIRPAANRSGAWRNARGAAPATNGILPEQAIRTLRDDCKAVAWVRPDEGELVSYFDDQGTNLPAKVRHVSGTPEEGFTLTVEVFHSLGRDASVSGGLRAGVPASEERGVPNTWRFPGRPMREARER